MYITLVQQPAMEATEDMLDMAPMFRRMYLVVAPLQRNLAVASSLGAFTTFTLQRCNAEAYPNAPLWLLGGSLMAVIAPYSIVFMVPLNLKLIDTKGCQAHGSAWMRASVLKWGKLHNRRTYVSIAAFTSMVVALTCSAKSAE